MDPVVRTETKKKTTISGNQKTTVTETIEHLASGSVRKSTETVTETTSTGSSPCQLSSSPCQLSSSRGASNASPAVLGNAKESAGSGDFSKDSLQSHNHYRQKHGVVPLKTSSQLTSYAQEWANHLAATNSFQHRPNNSYGENIYMKMNSNPNYQVTAKEAVDSWYSEIKDHTFGMEPRSMGTGHFTQVVWKGSNELGMAFAKGSGGRTYVVANYNPAGNMIGSYTQNVPPPK